MKSTYYIEYEIPTASGRTDLRGMTVHTREELEEYCEAIEKCGYKITMVNHHDREYGVF